MMELSYIPWLSMLRTAAAHIKERHTACRPAILTLEPGDMTRYRLLFYCERDGNVWIASETGRNVAVVNAGAFLHPSYLSDWNHVTAALVADLFNAAFGHADGAFYPKAMGFDAGFEQDLSFPDTPKWGPPAFMRHAADYAEAEGRG